MRKKSNKTTELKHCPFIDEKCLGPDCTLFHDQFSRCEIPLASFNMFKLASELQKLDGLLPAGGK